MGKFPIKNKMPFLKNIFGSFILHNLELKKVSVKFFFIKKLEKDGEE
jgi:hypothetical protein